MCGEVWENRGRDKGNEEEDEALRVTREYEGKVGSQKKDRIKGK